MSRAQQHLKSLLKISLAAGIIFYMVRSGAIDFAGFSKILSPKVIFIGLILVALNLVLTIQRWKLLLVSRNISVSFQEAGKLNLIGLFFNYIIPGGVGGDFVKIFYIVKSFPNQKAITAASILLDRLLGLFAMLIMTLIFLFLNHEQVILNPTLQVVQTAMLVLFALFTIGLLILFKLNANKLPLPQKMKSLYLAASSFGEKPKTIFQVIFLSLVAQSLSVLNFVLVGSTLGVNLSLGMYFFIVPIGFMLTAIPISPAGIGVGQVAFHFLFKVCAGGVTGVGALGITALQVFQFVFSLIGAWFFLRRKETLEELESAV